MVSPASSVLLERRSYFWPIVLFPHYENSHTVAFTGRHNLKDVKFSAGFVRLTMSDTALECRLLFPTFPIFQIRLADITDVGTVEGKEGLVFVHFSKARLGWPARFALSGDSAIPKDRVLLDLGDAWQEWLETLRTRADSAATQATFENRNGV